MFGRRGSAERAAKLPTVTSPDARRRNIARRVSSPRRGTPACAGRCSTCFDGEAAAQCPRSLNVAGGVNCGGAALPRLRRRRPSPRRIECVWAAWDPTPRAPSGGAHRAHGCPSDVPLSTLSSRLVTSARGSLGCSRRTLPRRGCCAPAGASTRRHPLPAPAPRRRYLAMSLEAPLIASCRAGCDRPSCAPRSSAPATSTAPRRGGAVDRPARRPAPSAAPRWRPSSPPAGSCASRSCRAVGPPAHADRRFLASSA